MRSALLFALTVSTTVFAQTKQERGKQIVQEALQAVGGDKFLAMENRVDAGRAYSFFREELSGLSVAKIYIQYLKPSGERTPDELLMVERQSFGKDEKSGSVLFLKDAAYEVTFRGARPLPEERMERYRDSAVHNILYILRERLDEPGMVFEYQGSDIVDNAPVFKVDITDANNHTVTVLFHHLTHLPLRQTYYWRDPKTGDRNEEVTIFGKFRDAGGGVMLPLDVQRLRNGDRVFQIYADSTVINQNLPESLFTLPTGIRILKTVK